MHTRITCPVLLLALLMVCTPCFALDQSAKTPPTSEVTEALKGFRGMMVGELVEKGDNEFSFKVQKIKKVWKKNKAENPEKAIGQTITLSLTELVEKHKERILKNYEEMNVGDKIVAEAFDTGGEVLFVKEWLRKAGDDD